MPLVTFLHPKGKSGMVPRNTTLLDAAKELGFPLNHEASRIKTPSWTGGDQ